MFGNYLKVCFRNIIRHKGYSFINITGLAVAIACCLLILVYLQYELSYDRFHKGAAQTYRIMVRNPTTFIEAAYIAMTPPPLAAAMKADFSEVETVTRFSSEQVDVYYQGQQFDRTRIIWADSSFVSVFSFPVYRGDIQYALSQPYSIAVTRSTARKIFGTEDAIGKIIRFGKVFDLQVNAVLEDVPATSHIQFDGLIAVSTRREYWKEDDDIAGIAMSTGGYSIWQTLSGLTYFRLAAGTDAVEFERRLNAWMADRPVGRNPLEVKLQSLTDIHLKGDLSSDIKGHGDVRFVYLLSGVTILILFIAAFNYMNLSTARSSTRAREVGLRKILGGTRAALVGQFLGESMLLTGVAVLGGILLANLAMPVFNSLVELDLKIDLLHNRFIQAGLAGIVIVVGFGAGIYPALFLSSRHAQNTIRGLTTATPRGSAFFRNALVVFQNVISITLIICTTVIYLQLSYMKHKDLGLNANRIMTIPIRDFRMRNDFQSLRREIAAMPGVQEVAWSTSAPFEGFGGASGVWWEGKLESERSPHFYTNEVSANFLDFYQIRLIEGRSLADSMGDDINGAYLINETAMKAMGWTLAVGKMFGISRYSNGVIIGVVKDFHFSSLRKEVEPMAMSLAEAGGHYTLSVKLTGRDEAGVIERIDGIWKNYSGYPFEFDFLNDSIERVYKSENRLVTLLAYASLLAIFVACLGLFGLASFGVERRTREIAIRKVMGARISKIVGLLSIDFVRLVLAANLAAWLIAFYAMSRWLQGYAYRVSLSFWIFGVAGFAAIVAAVLTIGYQAVRAARANPVDSLRHE